MTESTCTATPGADDMAKMGRPAKKPEDRRTINLQVLVTPAEEAKIRDRATFKGLSISSWLLEVIKKALR